MGMQVSTDLPIKHSEISAVITRADGSIEDCGVIAHWDRNPFKRGLWNLNRFIKKIWAKGEK